MTTLAFWNIGTTELLIVALVALLLFGRRLPEVGRSLGKGITEFKKGLKDVKSDMEADVDQREERTDKEDKLT